MTPRQRSLVVEVLRCAADLSFVVNPLSTASYRLRTGQRVAELAERAWSETYDDAVRRGLYLQMDGHYASMHSTLLEAAARVEEGTWP